MKEKLTLQKKTRILWFLVLGLTGITAVVMYRVHRAVPFMMDDLWYATMLSSEEPVRNLGDIVESQIWHYLNWGGRSLTHGILQLTLLSGEKAADILNVAVTFLLGGVVCLTAEVPKGGRLFALWAFLGMVLGVNANWKMSMFWQAGAANYLYITVFVLLFLYCYLREVTEPCGRSAAAADAESGAALQKKDVEEMDVGEAPKRPLPGIALWILPLGLLAGWSNENMGPVAFLISAAVIYFTLRENRKAPLWMFLGSLASLAGSILVIAAPGNFVRSARVEENQYGVLWRCFLRCYAESRAALEYLFPVLLVLLFVLFVAKGILKISLGRRNRLLLLGALASWGAMILSPHYPDRATFGTMILCICVIVSLCRRILAKRKELLTPLLGIAALVWLRGMFFLGEFLAISWGWIR